MDLTKTLKQVLCSLLGIIVQFRCDAERPTAVFHNLWDLTFPIEV